MDSDINYIIQQSLKGDKNYQEILLKRLNPLIFKNIYQYYLPSDPLTEDLMQEGYIIILQSLKDYDENRNAHFLHFVKIRLQYFYKNYCKKTKADIISIEYLKSMGKDLKSTNMNQLNYILLKEEKNELYKCINELSDMEKKVITLFYFEQYSIKDISEELNLTYNAVIYLKRKAVNKLKKMMTKLLFQ